MSYLQILVLAVIQGAAELLPVSSSAHVILAAKLMGLAPSDTRFVFLLVMLHTGTMFAVLVYFWPRWRWLFLATPQVAPGARRQFVLMLLVATALTGILGLALKAVIEKVILERMLGHEKAEFEVLFESLPLIAFFLFSVGVLIIASGWRERAGGAAIGLRAAIWIGLVQGLCLPFRGFSRSGATISTALFCGVDRDLAEDFSFALAVILTPPVIVRQVWKLLSAGNRFNSEGMLEMLTPGLIGMVFSFAAGLAALKVLSAVLERGRWRYFGYYCILAATTMAIAAALQV